MATQNNVRVQNITQECNQQELDELKAFDNLLLRQDLNVSRKDNKSKGFIIF